MKKILSHISDFIRKEFTWGTYAVVLIFLSGAITLNYYFAIENGIIVKKENALIRFLLYLLLYSTAYYGTLAIYSWYHCLPNRKYFWRPLDPYLHCFLDGYLGDLARTFMTFLVFFASPLRTLRLKVRLFFNRKVHKECCALILYICKIIILNSKQIGYPSIQSISHSSKINR